MPRRLSVYVDRPAPQRWARLLGLAVVSWLAWPLPAAGAEAPHVHLTWQRPLGSTCPPAGVLERDVEDTLDRKIFTSRRSAQLRIEGVIEENASGGTWVQLRARDRDGTLLGTRELRRAGGGCAGLRGDIVLVLTLLVETGRDAGGTSSLHVELGASASALVRVLPRWSVGFGPTLVVDIAGRLQLRADLAYYLPVDVRTQTGIQAGLHAISGALRACQLLLASERSWKLHACVGLQAGTWLVSQSAPATRPAQLRLLAQGMFDLRVGARLADAVQLELAAGPSLALHRTSLYAYYDEATRVQLYRVPFLGAQLQFGLYF